MNQTDKIMRQYFVQYPILKSVENYQCLVNFIFVFELLILYVPSFVFLAKSVIWTANFTAFFVQHNKFQKKSIALFWYIPETVQRRQQGHQSTPW